MYANAKIAPRPDADIEHDQDREDAVVAKASVSPHSAISSPHGRQVVRECLLAAYPELQGVQIRGLDLEFDGDDLTVRCRVRASDLPAEVRSLLGRNRDALFEEAMREQLRLEWSRPQRTRQR